MLTSAEMRFVLDASVTLAWLFDDEASDNVEAVRMLAEEHGVHVPMHWAVEVANAAIKGERRRRATAAQTSRFFDYLRMLDIVADRQDPAVVLDQLSSLAREYNISVYDAGYLALAERLQISLATGDSGLTAAARRAGVSLLV